MTTRRQFLDRALALAAMSGVPAKMWGAAEALGEPDLRIGVLSDIHLSHEHDVRSKTSPTKEMFIHALEYFRDRKVHGVLVCGDLADAGLVDELEMVADAWFKVFPGGKLPDGTPVANLMHYGDHDAERRFYRKDRFEPMYAKKGLPIPESLSEGENRKVYWEKYFKEPWSPIRHVKVRGYDFVLGNFMRECPGTTPGLADFLAKLNPDPKKPFFYSQHRWICGTYLADEEMWGGDSGKNGPVLTKYPNVVAFTGHTHYMLTDDRIVWQDGYTQINAGSLLNAPCGRQRENGIDISWYKNDYMRDTQMKSLNAHQGHHGMVFSLKGDSAVIERRDFGSDLPVGPDLVFSLSSKSHTRANCEPASVAPEFPQGGAVSAVARAGKNRKGEAVDQIVVTFPVAAPTKDTPRALDYEVRAEKADGTLLKAKRVYSPGINLPPEKDAAKAVCVFARSEVGAGPVRFVVHPANCWRKAGKPISVVFEAVPSFTMRIDDNHSPAEWKRVAEIFESRGMRVSFAIVPSSLSDAQGACLKELSDRGHVIMDHTPNHTFYRATYHDVEAFNRAKVKPFVQEVDEKGQLLYFKPDVDDAHPQNRRIKAKIEQNVLTFTDAKAPKRTYYTFVKLPGRSEIFGLASRNGLYDLRDFWCRPLKEQIDLPDVEVLLYDQAAIQPCDDILRELAGVSRERFVHFNLPLPTIWVRPGGWDPGVQWERLERIYGREFGYIGADSSVGGVWGGSRWTTGYDAMYFFDQGADITPEQLVDQIEKRLAAGKYHVTLSHMWNNKLPGRMDEYYQKTERFAQLLVDRKIPFLTMKGTLEARFGK